MCPSATPMSISLKAPARSAAWPWSPSRSRLSSRTFLSLRLWCADCIVDADSDLDFSLQAKFSDSPHPGFVPLAEGNYSYYIAVPTSLRVDPNYCKVKRNFCCPSVHLYFCLLVTTLPRAPSSLLSVLLMLRFSVNSQLASLLNKMRMLMILGTYANP